MHQPCSYVAIYTILDMQLKICENLTRSRHYYSVTVWSKIWDKILKNGLII